MDDHDVVEAHALRGEKCENVGAVRVARDDVGAAGERGGGGEVGVDAVRHTLRLQRRCARFGRAQRAIKVAEEDVDLPLFDERRHRLAVAACQVARLAQRKRAAVAHGAAPLVRTERVELARAPIVKRAAAGGAQAGVAVAFSLKPEARDALSALAKGEKSWVSLAVNTDDETIEFVDGFAELAADQWPSKLPEDKPLYIFIKAGDSLAMVYYCPDTAPIKQKMLGSTVKASAQAQAAGRELCLPHRCEFSTFAVSSPDHT